MMNDVSMDITTEPSVTEQIINDGCDMNRPTGNEWRVSERDQSWVTHGD